MTVAELIEKLKAMPQDMLVRYIDSEQGDDIDIEVVETDFDRSGRIYGSGAGRRPATYVVLSP